MVLLYWVANCLRDYLVNFCRAFIYTTALPPVSIAAMAKTYQVFPTLHKEREQLQKLVNIFQSATIRYEKLSSLTPVQSVIVPGNDAVKVVADLCRQHNFDVRPILYPTVPKNGERLRVVLHAFNTEAELRNLIEVLA